MVVLKTDAVGNLRNRIIGIGKQCFGKFNFLIQDIGF